MQKRAFRQVAYVVIATLALLIGACGASSHKDPPAPRRASVKQHRATVARASDPLARSSFYVVSSPAKLEAVQLRADGRTAAAAAVARLAAQPIATWMTGQPQVESLVRALTTTATRAGKSTLLVAYDIPGRDCSGYSAGGARSPAEYEHWITLLADGIGDRSATVIVEPDAIPQTLTTGCTTAAMASERLSLLHYAVATLKALPHVSVYIDAGNPGWIRPATRLVPLLRAAGIGIADGFSLNVANYYTTASVEAYGEALSQALGGKHFVIDTSRNGNGPPTTASTGPTWCNPPGRALGHVPSADTDNSLVDAYLWIKDPGDSDGTCGHGDPPAGQWMPLTAIQLALNSQTAS